MWYIALANKKEKKKYEVAKNHWTPFPKFLPFLVFLFIAFFLFLNKNGDMIPNALFSFKFTQLLYLFNCMIFL